MRIRIADDPPPVVWPRGGRNWCCGTQLIGELAFAGRVECVCIAIATRRVRPTSFRSQSKKRHLSPHVWRPFAYRLVRLETADAKIFRPGPTRQYPNGPTHHGNDVEPKNTTRGSNDFQIRAAWSM